MHFINIFTIKYIIYLYQRNYTRSTAKQKKIIQEYQKLYLVLMNKLKYNFFFTKRSLNYALFSYYV